MSNDEFESWLSLVGRLIGLSERQRKQISEELRDHLESRVADLLESGVERQAAILQAVEEFGDAAVLAKNLQSVSLRNRKRWMMRFTTLATAGLFLATLLTMAMWPEDARFGSPAQAVADQEKQDDPFGNDAPQVAGDPGNNPFGDGPHTEAPKPDPINLSMRTQANNRIRRGLEQPVSLVYDAELFGDVRETLSRDLGLNIVVDRNLEGVLDNNTEVTANLTGLPLSQSLRTMLRSHDATYVVKDGVLLIISIDDEGEPDFLSRRMFDVREVLRLIKQTESDRIGKPVNSVARAAVEARGGGGVFCLSPRVADGEGGEDVATVLPPVEPAMSQLLTAERLLVDTITRVVSPDAWEGNGGGYCDLTCIGGVMVVMANDQLAEQVEDFLVDLEYQLKNRN